MTPYRTGDKVTFTVPATVESADGGRVRIRFEGGELQVEPNALTMVRRSIHVDDDVMHGGRKAQVAQSLEEGVLLLRYADATGAAAYGIAQMDDVRHAADASDAAAPITSATPAPEPVQAAVPAADPVRTPVPAAKPEAPAQPTNPEAADVPSVAPVPAPAPAVAKGQETHADDTLELDSPIDYGSDPVPPSAAAPSLSGMITRSAPRRAAIDLESIGTTETVSSVAESRGEMLLGDDGNLRGGQQS